MSRLFPAFLFFAAFAVAQSSDPAYPHLEKAYAALREKSYDAAIQAFEQAARESPKRADIHKNLAYTLLKIGENEAARDQFAAAMRLDPSDTHVALEYAFLCYETKQQAVARRVFDRIRKTGDAASRATAEQAFQNIDQPLAEGIARWQKAVAIEPDNFSAHLELARLAEQRDETALAAEHYEKAWHLRPELRSLLLDLGRTWKELGRTEDADAALLAASRGAEPRVAEAARELLVSRYPYVYEFQKALAMDPKNVDLRRELAYLYLAMDRKDDAELQFLTITEQAPDDLLSVAQLGFLRLARKDFAGATPLLDRVLKNADGELADRVRTALKLPQTLQRRDETPRANVSIEAKVLAERSLKAGYLKDALKYLKIAHESDPVDFSVMLKLGWTYNVLKQDNEAVKWFRLASKSPDPAIASEAEKAYKNLEPGLARFRTTVWMLPFFSTRWHDMFAYAQVKEEMKLGDLWFRPYLSVRFVGDALGSVGPLAGAINPQYLSESSLIFAGGVATKVWHGAMGWAEAGESVKYLTSRTDVGAAIPDYRGGISYSKGFGHMLTRTSHGLFAESNDDGVFVSRFADDLIAYSQNRTGYTFRPAEGLDGFQAQLYWNWNVTADEQKQYWANYVETGPGLRFRFSNWPQSLLFTVNAVRGAYLINAGNPRGPNFNDLRAGFWYAFTH
ncbi:MAG TPA: tetratricopeptide repeat protein [Bryobacteraceae bacterium]|nr:tetratricopeptide repeat protein [Bryobacteraceae bacterium]